MNHNELDAMEQRLKERMDSGDKANRDRIDQVIIERSEDIEEHRTFRRETREDHKAVRDGLSELKQLLIPLPSLIVAVNALDEWKEKHNEHHGGNDKALARRIGVDEGVERTDRKWRNRAIDALKFLTGGGLVALAGGIAKLLDKI